jgi:hypothetical protein
LSQLSFAIVWSIMITRRAVWKEPGKGKYGSVFEYAFKETTVAVKRLQLLDCDDAARTERMQEGNVMTNLIHHNVLRLIAEQEGENFKLT